MMKDCLANRAGGAACEAPEYCSERTGVMANGLTAANFRSLADQLRQRANPRCVTCGGQGWHVAMNLAKSEGQATACDCIIPFPDEGLQLVADPLLLQIAGFLKVLPEHGSRAKVQAIPIPAYIFLEAEELLDKIGGRLTATAPLEAAGQGYTGPIVAGMVFSWEPAGSPAHWCQLQVTRVGSDGNQASVWSRRFDIRFSDREIWNPEDLFRRMVRRISPAPAEGTVAELIADLQKLPADAQVRHRVPGHEWGQPMQYDTPVVISQRKDGTVVIGGGE